MLRSCFLSSFLEFYSAVSEEKLKMSHQIIGRGGHFVFPIHLKNTNLVEGVKILLLIKFRQIPFSGFRGEVKNVSANQRQGRPFCFFPIGLKNTNLVEGIESLLPVKWGWIPFSGFREQVGNVSANQTRVAILFFQSARKTQTWLRALRSCFLSSFVKFRSAVPEEKSKMSQPIRDQGGHLVFPIRPKNTNLVEGLEILLPVRFRCIPISGFRGEVENVSANQKPVQPSCFSDPPEKHKLGRGPWDLASCQVSLNSVQRFQRKSRKCLSQSEARAAILFFRSARKTQTW